MRTAFGVVALALALVGVQALAAETVAVKVGEKRVLDVGALTRIAVGDMALAEVKVVGKAQVEVTGASPGKTTLLVWTQSGERVEYLLDVTGEAKAPQEAKAPGKAAPPPASEETVKLKRGQTRTLTFESLTRVAVGDPTIADVEIQGEGSVRVKGREQGKTTLLVWTGGQRKSYLIDVKR